jgi:hypothetical protein
VSPVVLSTNNYSRAGKSGENFFYS